MPGFLRQASSFAARAGPGGVAVKADHPGDLVALAAGSSAGRRPAAGPGWYGWSAQTARCSGRAWHGREGPGTAGASVVGQADEHELAGAGRLPATVGRNRGQVERPRDRLDAHQAPPGSQPPWQAARRRLSLVLVSFTPGPGAVHRRTRTAVPPRSGTLAACSGWRCAVLESLRSGGFWSRAWSQFWSHSPPSGAVHRRPPGTNPGRSRTVAAPGERRPTLLESVLGASPREFESRILRSSDQRKGRRQAD